MQIRLRDLAVAELPAQTRLPFRFGAVTVTAAPLLSLQLRVEAVDGRSAVGMASDLLVPKWFRKDLERSAADDQQALRASVARTAALATNGGFAGAWQHWQGWQQELVESLPPQAGGLLEAGFGVALIERAMLDGLCRLAGQPFWTALHTGLFRPTGELGEALAATPGLLPQRPASRIAVRHTVGRLDALRSDEIPATERLRDGMPQALDEVLRQHGVRWLKIKIGGGHQADVARLVAIGNLLQELDAAAIQVTLDGNEQIADLAALLALWQETASIPAGRWLLARVRWIEQPLPRNRSEHGRDDPHHCLPVPLVLDEGDGQRDTFRQSHHAGVSVKNCKGVFRALLNRLVVQRSNGHRFQTSEDLTNLPVLALQQDLCLASCLDLGHSERNGHHYFPGLQHLPPKVRAAALRCHPDLYAATADGPVLRISAGMLQLDSLQTKGFGCEDEVVAALASGLDWQAVPTGWSASSDQAGTADRPEPANDPSP
jgi:hypothetical protein